MKIIINILILFTSLYSWGQQNKLENEKVNSVFWKITDPSSKHVSYLFGTMHMVSRDKFVMPNAVKMKLLRSDVLFLELVDFDSFEGIEEMISEGPRMTDVLNKNQRDSLYAFTEKELKMDSASFESIFGKIHPMLFSSLLTKDFLTKGKSYDMTLYNLAKENGVTTEGLETVKEQLAALDKMTDETKAEYIMNTVRNGALAQASFQLIEKAYFEQNLSIMMKPSTDGEKVDQFFEEDLLDLRNLKWMEILSPRLKSQNIFIGVGAAHLVGNSGLINLLTQQGFTVEPIRIRLTK